MGKLKQAVKVTRCESSQRLRHQRPVTFRPQRHSFLRQLLLPLDLYGDISPHLLSCFLSDIYANTTALPATFLSSRPGRYGSDFATMAAGIKTIIALSFVRKDHPRPIAGLLRIDLLITFRCLRSVSSLSFSPPPSGTSTGPSWLSLSM